MITAVQLIDKLLKSKNYIEIFTNLTEWKHLYKEYIKLIHPDICKLAGVNDANHILNKYREEIEKGKKYTDDAGTVTYFTDKVVFVGDYELLETSFKNFNYLISLKDKGSLNFRKYLPKSALLNKDSLTFFLDKRAIPVCSLGILNQKHTNWIVSRMLELTAWFESIGYVHNGINPESIFVIPENHGIYCLSFYHMVKTNVKLKSVSAKFQHFYSPSIFINKKGITSSDIECSKRTGIYLLGDKSGSGVKLRKTHDLEMLNFLQKQQNVAYDCYKEYRELLSKKYNTKEFLPLEV